MQRSPSSMSSCVILATIAAFSGCGNEDASEDQPPTSCKERCIDNNDACSLDSVEQFPSMEETRTDWEAQCGQQRPFARMGACSNGTQILTYSTGFNGELRFYDEEGRFMSVIAFTDNGGYPCWGQGYWPSFPECEDPIVVDVLCGGADRVGESMTLWYEPER